MSYMEESASQGDSSKDIFAYLGLVLGGLGFVLTIISAVIGAALNVSV